MEPIRSTVLEIQGVNSNKMLQNGQMTELVKKIDHFFKAERRGSIRSSWV